MILDKGYVHGGDIYSRAIRLDFSANVNRVWIHIVSESDRLGRIHTNDFRLNFALSKQDMHLVATI